MNNYGYNLNINGKIYVRLSKQTYRSAKLWWKSLGTVSLWSTWKTYLEAFRKQTHDFHIRLRSSSRRRNLEYQDSTPSWEKRKLLFKQSWWHPFNRQDAKTVKTTQEYTDSKGRLRKRTVSKREGTTQRYFYEKNHLGSIVRITDSLWRAIEEYTYDVFGKAYINKDLYDRVMRGDLWEAVLESQELEDEGVNEMQTYSEENLLIENKVWIQYHGRGIINNTRLYTWREYDREIGLYYLRARYYSADLGRFISRWIADDLNLYAYVGNSPVMGVDLSGLACEDKLLVNDLWKDTSAFVFLNMTWIWWEILWLEVSSHMSYILKTFQNYRLNLV